QEWGGPPVLRRPGSDKSAEKPSDKASDKPGEKPKLPEAAPATPPAPAAAPAPVPTPAAAPAPPPAADEEKDRPVLRRGKPASMPVDPIPSSPAIANSHVPSAIAAAAKSGIEIIAAISDAHGPDLRPYTYNLKPDEEQTFRKKMLALAADEINARVRLLTVGAAQPSAT